MESAETGTLYRRASYLAVFTIVYNLIEGAVSVWFGAADETLALFGFGVDSFIEVISAVGVWHMLRRIRGNNGETRDEFEQRALRITGSRLLPAVSRPGADGGAQPLPGSQARGHAARRDHLLPLHLLHVVPDPSQDQSRHAHWARRPSWPMRPAPGPASGCRWYCWPPAWGTS